MLLQNQRKPNENLFDNKKLMYSIDVRSFVSYQKMSSTTTCNQSGWCLPLIIFTVLVLFHALQLFNRDFIRFVDTELWFLVIAGAVGLFMYQLCKCGHRLWAFGFLLFPLLIFVIATYINRAQGANIGEDL